MPEFQVIVGNIGTVYEGNSRHHAVCTYDEYVGQSKMQTGRASGEQVTVMEDGEPLMTHEGWMHLFENHSNDELQHWLSTRRAEDPKDQCPNCGGTPFEMNSGTVYVAYDEGRDCRYKKYMKCSKCGLEWNDILRVVGIELLTGVDHG